MTSRPAHNLLPYGKLEPRTFKQVIKPLLARVDRSVLIGPQLGVDAAVVRPPAGDIVITCDPITLAEDLVGYYAVHVNVNDLAVMGAEPKFMTVCLIAPPTTPARLRRITAEIARQAHRLNVAVVGGHTEISAAVNQPVVVATMIGRLGAAGPIGPAGGKAGDVIVMTKSAAVETTAIIAREKYSQLRRRGFAASTLDRARRFLRNPGISILAEARIAAKAQSHAMHDATEGGLVTALWELAQASSLTAVVDLTRIPVRPITRKLCDVFQIDPLRCISSGSLLIAISQARLPGLLAKLKAAGCRATPLGRLQSGRSQLIDQLTGARLEPCNDEITKLWS